MVTCRVNVRESLIYFYSPDLNFFAYFMWLNLLSFFFAYNVDENSFINRLGTFTQQVTFILYQKETIKVNIKEATQRNEKKKEKKLIPSAFWTIFSYIFTLEYVKLLPLL